MSQTKFGFVMPQGWRWLDPNGCSPVEQEPLGERYSKFGRASGLRYSIFVRPFDGRSEITSVTARKTFLKLLHFSLLCSISHQVFVLGNWSPATRIEIPLSWLRWSLQWIQ